MRAALTTLLAANLLAGCTALGTGKLEGEGCVRTLECAPSLACVDGMCSADLTGIMGNIPPAMPPADDAAPPDGDVPDGFSPDGGPPPPMDSGPPTDSGPPPPMDSGPPPMDSGPPPMDSGPPPMDSGPPPTDSGPPPTDSGPPPADAGADA